MPLGGDDVAVHAAPGTNCRSPIQLEALSHSDEVCTSSLLQRRQRMHAVLRWIADRCRLLDPKVDSSHEIADFR